MHLGYCTNIHPGETWADHFQHLREQVPAIKAAVSPTEPLPLGLRLANLASIDLLADSNLTALQTWLSETGCYVYTMNGFPYGGFHNERVKDQVHAPDWTTNERTDYTIRLFRLLARLLPADETDGGVSTSPLSYRLWWTSTEAKQQATQSATQNILRVLGELLQIRAETGKVLHLDIEPEPDGLLDNVADFVAWYTETLRPAARMYLAQQRGLSESDADTALRDHVQLCYDVCHVAVAYEDMEAVLASLTQANIRVGKIQVSSALRLQFDQDVEATYQAISNFDEPTYLHQVVARRVDDTLTHYDDLPDALADFDAKTHREWRVHFHVPLFLERYGLLQSTQNSVVEILTRQRTQPFTNQLEIETYTWGVLPADLQLPISDSISREIDWVKNVLKY